MMLAFQSEQQNGSGPASHPAVGAPGGPGSRPPALPATDRRNHLVEILENYGLSVAGFDALRKDAYEKQVAAESPEKLEQVYEALLDPALGFAEARERCPVWPEGSRQAGKLPSMMTLREIKERLLLEWSVRDRVKHSGFLKQLQAVGLDNEEVLEAAAMILGEELFSAKLNGKPISENLRVFDRWMRVMGLQLRLRREKRQQDKRGDAENAAKENPKSNQRAAGPQSAGADSNRELQERLRKAFKTNAEPTNKAILSTGYEPLNWLPAVKDKDRENLESLVDMVMGGASGEAKG
jgi:hypothetical protein